MADENKMSVSDEKKMYEQLINEKKEVLKRTQETVEDDAKYGIQPKSAIPIQRLHHLGIPTSVIQKGTQALSEAGMMLTKSDKDICEYYSNYDKNVEQNKSQVANVIKAVDRQDEDAMRAMNDLNATKLRYNAYKASVKQSERLAKANELTKTVVDDKSGLSGDLADYLSLDK